MKIAVLYGGVSAEREVSLSSGKQIMNALEAKGHEVIGVDFHPDRLEEIIQLNADIVFIGLHGKYGEDGKLQSLLDMLKIPYVGSGVLASALAMDKARSKQFFKNAGIRTAKEVVLEKKLYREDKLDVPFGFPLVVKPNHEGSTIGLTIAKNKDEMLKGIASALLHDHTVMVEEFVSGKEVTVAVMGEKGSVNALPVVEIVPKNEYYDYESKYAEGGSVHYVPARLDEKTTSLLQKQAVLAHEVLGCEVYSRVDFIIPSDGSEPVILEVNTLPGMTPTSLFPDAAKEVGLSYPDMIEKLIQLSLQK
ncbi:D-alanine--D-alanine ligase [Fictibacillus sp. WQ 8-8]|uniref:D-alanine--D-alanine ligase n=1 Tax=Fictibacillus marinisediminis TaxID=2878389 RepID=A0A9X1XB85_9BACL|nr:MULTISPECIES: D-alanine--D-alanine ligase [Fictibacillus]MCK6257541.1 D-alanine--D-alanine ligase [Fictibacillus marinisediminis]MCQ6266057.1 D-alanine--D-alanine ligase [Fictibacillus sp. WQ 8-8]MED2972723.1 D-alanine--D-alanine ligase [Fictibacillus sp. B-59209]SFD72827.1 D-alanine--D-alanine ligase [Bacillus sp. OV194]